MCKPVYPIYVHVVLGHLPQTPAATTSVRFPVHLWAAIYRYEREVRRMITRGEELEE